MPAYYPVFLNLKGRLIVVIGGGLIAEGKARRLLEHDCRVNLVSPDATPALAQWSRDGKIDWQRRKYRAGDLKGAFLAIAATGDMEANHAIAAEARAENVTLNVVDYPPLCDFIAPSIVERGPVTFAISTSGASPALARKLRESMEKSPLLDYAEIAPFLSEARKEVKRRGIQAPPDRWQRYINRDLIDAVRSGDRQAAMESLLRGLATGDDEAP